MKLSPKFEEALIYATRVHGGQLRKKTGVPVEVRQKFTGHASAEMNAHYTHHEIETLRSAIGKLPRVRP